MTARPSFRSALSPAFAIAALGLLSACSTMGISEIGRAPKMSNMNRDASNVAIPMPMPEPQTAAPNSLWRTGSRAFFKDQRASRVGDVLTVEIAISDQAKVDNETTRSRTTADKSTITNLLGLQKMLPSSAGLPDLADTGSSVSNNGIGKVTRKDDINMTVAAVVTQVLPNGNLVIQGRQEVRVNFDLRELLISGVVRPEDITSANTIKHTQIAEARIAYGGRGQLMDVQQPRYGSQIMDRITPF